MRRHRHLSPDRIALILRYCQPWHEVWAPSTEWTTAYHVHDKQDVEPEPELLWMANVRALSRADEVEADALRRAREFRPAPLAP